MPLNIKNDEVERLAGEVAEMAGETKTEAIRKALIERKGRLTAFVTAEQRLEQLLRFLQRDIWPQVPKRMLGHAPKKKEREDILGYGDRGV